MKPKICVVGSANIDQVSYVKRAPNDGETLFGEDYQMGFGGKGANQAVMAGLLGAEVYVIACLGSDVYREMTIENFKNNNVITDYIQTVEGSSGVAPIWVDESGQNRIVVIPGANNLLYGFSNGRFSSTWINADFNKQKCVFMDSSNFIFKAILF